MAAQIIIPKDTSLYRLFHEMAEELRMVFFAGLPGVGKSLLLQQLALIAGALGRTVYLLQWDVTRAAFETPAILARYPEVDGVTHPMIRKAVGVWARDGIRQWHERHPEDRHLLIGEVTLVGNRLSELAQCKKDDTETLLVGPRTLFLIPVPTPQVRQSIERARELTIRQPRHERESADAPPNVLQALWQEAHRLAQRLGLTNETDAPNIPYDPQVYVAVYKHLLQHRQVQVMPIDAMLPAGGSVYDLNAAVDLAASAAEVARIMEKLEQNYSEDRLNQEVATWYRSDHAEGFTKPM